MGELTELVNN